MCVCICPTAVFLPLLVLFYYVRTRYIVCSRECKRWEAVSRSPVYAFFAQSIKGLPTIRSYGAGKASGAREVDFLCFNGRAAISPDIPPPLTDAEDRVPG